MGLFVLAVLAVKTNSRNQLILVPACISLFFLLTTVAMNERCRRPCGVWNFLVATADTVHRTVDAHDTDTAELTIQNPIDFLAPWTMRANHMTGLPSKPWGTVSLQYLVWIGPLPSQLLPVDCPVLSLTTILGTEDICGINTPGNGRILRRFRISRLSALGLIGISYREIESRASALPRVFRMLFFLFLCASFPFSMHNGLRAGLRPVWYCVAILCCFAIFEYHRQRSEQRFLKTSRRGIRHGRSSHHMQQRV